MTTRIPCLHCGEEVFSDMTRCTFCDGKLTPPPKPIQATPHIPLVLLSVLALVGGLGQMIFSEFGSDVGLGLVGASITIAIWARIAQTGSQ